jgi:hypothetical protein
MGKHDKKKSWWELDAEDVKSYPKSAEQHKQRLKVYTPDGNEVEDLEYEYQESFDFGWDRKCSYDSESKKATETADRDYWKSYYHGGSQWGGYGRFRPQELSYNYVTQMANMLAAQHKINVQIGNEWSSDLESKTLTYNPASLVYGTKRELLATLLHEIGKLRYAEHYNVLWKKSTYTDTYGIVAYHAMLPFDELRVDFKMIGEYGSAAEIYEAQEPQLQKVFEDNIKYAELFREWASKKFLQEYRERYDECSRKVTALTSPPKHIGMELLEMEFKRGISFDAAIDNVKKMMVATLATAKTPSDIWQETFGLSTAEEVKETGNKIYAKLKHGDNLYDYIAGVYSSAYLLGRESQLAPRTADFVAKSADSIKRCASMETSFDVLGELDKNVFPTIEELLKEAQSGSDEMRDFLGNAAAERIMQRTWDEMIDQKRFGNINAATDLNGNPSSRTSNSSGQTSQTIVPEWVTGGYKVLKDSVLSEIRSLTRMLTFLRRSELTVRWTNDHKRGKLDAKKLHKVATGSKRVFRRKAEAVDTVRSFAFSILLDVSGSMDGSRITNTARGLIVLAETFKNMGVPFEIIVFSGSAKHIKTFDQELKKAEPKIGGLPRNRGGGTNLDFALNILTIQKRPEKNKVVVVLTDGGVGGGMAEFYDRRYFAPLAGKGIKSVALGIETTQPEIQDLCLKTGKAIGNAAAMPLAFSELVKNLMVRK